MAQQTQPVWKSNKSIEFMEIILVAGGLSQKNWVGCAAILPIPLPYLWPEPYIKILFQTCFVIRSDQC